MGMGLHLGRSSVFTAIQSTHADCGTVHRKLESPLVHSPCDASPTQSRDRHRRGWGLCGAVLVGFLPMQRTGEILSLKVRQVCFHDATLPDSKGTHRCRVAEFVANFRSHCHSSATQIDRRTFSKHPSLGDASIVGQGSLVCAQAEADLVNANSAHGPGTRVARRAAHLPTICNS